MRVVVAGGREFNDFQLLQEELEHFEEYNSTSELIIVCGKARGADTLGEKWAKENERDVVYFPADWSKYGRSAGYRRNAEMADYSEALIAFWDGKSKGTKHMIDLALGKGLLVKVVKY